MDTTTLYLANGLIRTVKGSSEDVSAALIECDRVAYTRVDGAVLMERVADDRIRRFYDTDGEILTVNAEAVALVEAADVEVEKRTFGFSRVLDA